MPRYIDADIAHNMLLRGYVINDVPTADVREIRYAKRISYHDNYGNHKKCSVCGSRLSAVKAKYCSHCGSIFE